MPCESMPHRLVCTRLSARQRASSSGSSKRRRQAIAQSVSAAAPTFRTPSLIPSPPAWRARRRGAGAAVCRATASMKPRSRPSAPNTGAKPSSVATRAVSVGASAARACNARSSAASGSSIGVGLARLVDAAQVVHPGRHAPAPAARSARRPPAGRARVPSSAAAASASRPSRSAACGAPAPGWRSARSRPRAVGGRGRGPAVRGRVGSISSRISASTKRAQRRLRRSRGRPSASRPSRRGRRSPNGCR